MDKKKFSKVLMTGASALCFLAVLFGMPKELKEAFQDRGSIQMLTDAYEQVSKSSEEKENRADTETVGEMQVHFLDVGQADCILIACDGQYMLVDAGKNEDGARIVDYLKEQGVKRLDYVIGTHPHEDHIGSLDTIIEEFEIGTLLMPEVVHTTRTFEDVITAVERKNLAITPPRQGDTYTIGSGEFTILAPAKKDYGSELNNWSIGIRLIHGRNSIIMCGDAEEEAEKDICESGLELSADVLKLGHHGSSTSTSDRFLKAVNPQYAVISCGKGNDYGHPHKETLDKLSASHIKTFRTDKQGTILLISDGKEIYIEGTKE